jgi:hypothetical protein
MRSEGKSIEFRGSFKTSRAVVQMRSTPRTCCCVRAGRRRRKPRERAGACIRIVTLLRGLRRVTACRRGSRAGCWIGWLESQGGVRAARKLGPVLEFSRERGQGMTGFAKSHYMHRLNSRVPVGNCEKWIGMRREVAACWGASSGRDRRSATLGDAKATCAIMRRRGVAQRRPLLDCEVRTTRARDRARGSGRRDVRTRSRSEVPRARESSGRQAARGCRTREDLRRLRPLEIGGKLTDPSQGGTHISGGYSSGQRGQTVNLLA